MATKDLEVVAKQAGSSSWLFETEEVPAKPAGSPLTETGEVPAKPAGSPSWLTESGEVPAKPAGSSSWLTEIQEMVEGACNLEYDHLKEANSTQSQIDLSVRHLRDYIIAIGPEFYSPGEVQESYECLQKAIHDFAAGFFPTVTWAQLSPDEQSKVKAWAPRAEQFMESQRGRQALFQAWLWHILDDNIFSANPSTKWQGVKDTMMPWHLVGQLMDIFQSKSHYFDLLQLINAWISLTPTLPCSRFGHQTLSQASCQVLHLEGTFRRPCL